VVGEAAKVRLPPSRTAEHALMSDKLRISIPFQSLIIVGVVQAALHRLGIFPGKRRIVSDRQMQYAMGLRGGFRTFILDATEGLIS
jgi:hypothetical protein